MPRLPVSGHIESFEKLFGEVVYDWRTDEAFKLKALDDGRGYSFGKSVVYKDKKGYFFEYKDTCHSITRDVFDKFMTFAALFHPQNSRLRTVYVDGTDFYHEVGETDCTIYKSVQQALEQAYCADECGVVKAKLVFESWAHPAHLDAGKKPTDGEDEKRWFEANTKVIEGTLAKIERYLKLRSDHMHFKKINDQFMVIQRLTSKLKKCGVVVDEEGYEVKPETEEEK